MAFGAKITSFWRRNTIDILLIVVLLVVAGVPRLWGLGTFLTADEKNWIGRSYEFVRAFKDFRFNDMLQTTHPGVITLWVVGGAVIATIVTRHIPFSSQTLQHFVWSSQAGVALVNALAVPAMYFLLRKLLPGRTLPFLAALFVALDPFVIGYSRVAHVDALLMSFLTLTILSLLIYGKTQFDRRWLVVSAVLFGIALLSKVPAIFSLPFLLLTVLVFHMKGLFERPFMKERGRDILEWLLIAGLLFVFVWPAILFVPNPQGNVLTLKRDIVSAAQTPHNTTEEYTLNPWHYPAALLARTTPVTLIFSLVAVGLLLAGLFTRKDFLPTVDSRVAWLLVGYIFFFVVMMTLGAKKGDRYILPVWPAIDILAALGVWGMASWLKLKQDPIKVFFWGGGAVATWLLVTVVWYHPYEIAYSNPLLADNLSQELGWGEGLEQVAGWLNEHSPNAVVASWYPEELGAFTMARVVHINAHEQNQVQYVVLYKNMFGRAPDHPANNFIDEYYQKREPVFVAHVAGREFAWVYAKPVYERVVGELTPDVVVGQELAVSHEHLAVVEVFAATYSGKATAGEMIVALKDGLHGAALHAWEVPVASLNDAGWTRFWLPADMELEGKRVVIQISTRGTSPGNAPTVRYAATHDYIPGDYLLSRVGSLAANDKKSGDLAVRLRYRVGTDLASDEESKLFTR